MSTTILVFGPTGNVGPHAVDHLIRRRATVRVFALAHDELVHRLPAQVDVVTGDLADPATVEPALVGVDGVLLMWPFFTLDVATAPAVVRLLEQHVRRVAFVSSIGVHIGLEPVANRCHSYLEQLLEQTSLEWTFLRTTGFSANALGWAPQLRAGDTLRFPYGAAARSTVDEADLAEVAAAVLTENRHAGCRYLVTGSESLSQEEHLHAIAAATGRTLRWQEVEHGEARRQLVASGWPPAYADGALDYFEQLAVEPELVGSAVGDVLGRPPRTFAAWARAYADRFQPSDGET